MKRYLVPIATFTTIAMLPLSPPSLAARLSASSPTVVLSDRARLAAQTTRFGALGVSASAYGAGHGAGVAFDDARRVASLLALRAPSVLVAGGTPAGVAAAIAAARQGSDVTLVSASRELGGVLTDAMMDQWDLNRAPDGRSIEGGIFADMYARLGDAFSPAAAARALAAMVAAEPRIRVVYDATPVRVATSATPLGRHVDAVAFRRARGRILSVPADAFVDATDDGDVVAEAGARYDIGRQDTGIDERAQSVTLMFAMTNVDWATLSKTYRNAAYGPGGVTARRAWGYAKFASRYRPLDANTSVRDLNFGRLRDGTVTVNAIDLCGVDGLSQPALDRAYRLAMGESYALLAYLRAELPGFARAHVARFANRLYVRETRHVAGLERLTAPDIWKGRVPADAIGLSSYPIDLHAVVPGQLPAYAPVRHVYGIPFGALAPRGFTNVVMASPAISASHLAAGSSRIVPTTVEEGEAAGIAAGTSATSGVDLATMAREPASIADLRARLVAAGAILRVPPPLARSAGSMRPVTTPETWDLLATPG